MRSCFLLALAWLTAFASLAQIPPLPSPVPATYSFSSPAEYDRYAPQVVAAVNWLEKSTLPSDNPERRAANTFIMQWVTGSPTVSVQIEEYLAPLYRKDPDLLIIFIGGWTRYAIQHPSIKDKQILSAEGLKTMLTAYQAKGGKGNSKLDDLVKITAQGQLPDWVRAHVKG